MNAREGTPPTAGDIEEIAARVFETIPETLRKHAAEVRIRVVEFPTAEVMREMEIDSSFDLLGLYQGVPIGDKSVSDVRHDIDMIFLYRRPLLDYWVENNARLEDVVRHVLIHEIGHHFGFSDDDMEDIEESG
ncbi:MAG: metallopeptidase family protein [Rhodospirillaceae bacterium]|jgi:predicted Zn-dependent protease with MMP-like domain|nr:metallopeptidase family protein [Rhodospirillaceae bacterium]MBT3927004.1 metallopeptidase family protein [Rhodospirillaceae bacterium]MBT4427089.1 metallopeptidase family protein [Rhodospirillaceae bacterium]MBT5038862.1 metallopeptidase family protein [Rhodospirillaceae bacterium]MBT5675653.1 metallopeptidase family protein [Rhodospirillaceae bacterium]